MTKSHNTLTITDCRDNTIIIEDCLEVNTSDDITRALAEDGRYTRDRNGNITDIDGREVINSPFFFSVK